MEMLEEHRCFEGWQQRWRHDSSTLNCPMTFSIFLPPPRDHTPPPVLYWLSGLTCNDENFTTKAGAQRVAAELGIVLVMPDTSPRGEQVANDDGYDLGQGAGFYLNATQPPWATHYRMYDYLRDELPALVQSQFNVSDRCAISGHSMGGHGALIMALKNPGKYTSVSAFAPKISSAFFASSFFSFAMRMDCSMPKREAYVVLPSRASLPRLFPSSSPAVTSKTSSTIWKTRPTFSP